MMNDVTFEKLFNSTFVFLFLKVMATIVTTQARHDCEKIANTGLEPASQDRSS